jgi:acetylornithine deacetylase
MAFDPLASITEDLVLDIATDLLRFPTVLGEEGPAGEALAARMGALGYEVHLQEVVSRRFNVIGVVRGRGGGENLLLNGHLDVPAPVPGWTRDPWTPLVQDGWLYGNGVTDMKGGLASIIAAGAGLIRSGVPLSGDLIVAAVMHHDTTGLGTKFLLQSLDVPVHHSVVGEPTDLAVQLAHSGACQFELTTAGRIAHVSRREEGVDAIRKMMKLLDRLSDATFSATRDPRLPYLPRLVVGQISGGVAAGRTAPSCSVRGDVRLAPGMSGTTVLRDLQRLIEDLRAEDRELQATARILVTQTPFMADEASPIVGMVRDAHPRVVGRPPRVTTDLPAGSFVTDAADMIRVGIPAVVYGPCEWRTVPDERARVADIVTAARVYAQTALTVCEKPR